MKKQFIIREAPNPSRQNAILAVQAAEVGMVVEIKPQVKRRIQEEKYHAMLGDISKQFKFCDRLWDQEDMKRILVDAFKKDTITEYFDLWKQVGDIEFAPALDGRGV